MNTFRTALLVLLGLTVTTAAYAHQDHAHDDHADHAEHHDHGDHATDAGDHADHGDAHGDDHATTDGAFDPTPMIMHHIADANEFHVWGDFSIPLPVIMFDATAGKLDVMMSSAFDHGHTEHAGYVLDHGRVKLAHNVEVLERIHHLEDELAAADDEAASALEAEISTLEKSVHDVYDLSITKNVFTMLLTAAIMLLVFLSVAKAYRTRTGQAPRGLQGFLEPLILFIRDEVAQPNLGHKSDKFLPYLLTIFFFIWINNLLGLIPIFPGSANVTGNIAVTFSLAFLTLLVTNVSANKDYWQHIFWMPGVPVPVRLLLMPIELIGVLTKPFALMIRLFANITAGHIIVLSLVSLIFVFGNAGTNPGGAAAGAAIAIPFTLFISLIELLVAFIQAFIFTMLSAVFIGLAIEEHEHH